MHGPIVGSVVTLTALFHLTPSSRRIRSRSTVNLTRMKHLPQLITQTKLRTVTYSGLSISGISVVSTRLLANKLMYLWFISSWQLPSLGLRFTVTREVYYEVITTAHTRFRITTFSVSCYYSCSSSAFPEIIFLRRWARQAKSLMELRFDDSHYISDHSDSGCLRFWLKWNFLKIRVTAVHPLCSFPGCSSSFICIRLHPPPTSHVFRFNSSLKNRSYPIWKQNCRS